MPKIIEAKVWAALAAGAGGGALVSCILWVLGVVFWHVSSAAGSAAAAIAAVPAPVSGLLILGVPSLCAALAGYLAPHTARPDLTPVVEPAPPSAQAITAVMTGLDP